MADRRHRSPEGSSRTKGKEPAHSALDEPPGMLNYEEPRMRAGAEEGEYSSSSSSSSSIVILRSFSWNKFGIRISFTAPSERRRRSSRLFKIGNSSSSVNDGLAYGTAFIERPKRRGVRSRKGKEIGGDRYSDRENNRISRGRREEGGKPPLGRAQTDAETLAIGAGLAKLGRDQNKQDLRNARNGRGPELPGTSSSALNQGLSRGLVNSRPSHGSDTVSENGWESAADSDSEESADSRLAFGEENRGGQSFWGRKKNRKSTIVDPRLFSQNTLHSIITEPVGFGDITPWTSTNDFGQHSEFSEGQATLQRVYPIPTSDPGRFNARASSVVSGPEPIAVSRPGPIPIQQPQPITPVSQSVYEPVYVLRQDKVPTSSGRGKSLAEAALVGVASTAVSAAIASSRDDRMRREDEELDDRNRIRRRDSERESKDDGHRDKRSSPDREQRRGKRREKDDFSRVSVDDSRRERRRDEPRDENDERRERRERRREERRGETHSTAPIAAAAFSAAVAAVHHADSRLESRSDKRRDERPKDEVVTSPTASTVSKGVIWGENETKYYEVESPSEHRDEFVSQSDIQAREAQEDSNPAAIPKAKSKGWGAIDGIMGAGVGASAAASSSETSQTSKSRGGEKDAPYEYRVVVVEPESTPQSSSQRNGPSTGPKPSSSSEPSRLPGAFNDDLDFTAIVAAGLQDYGFDPNIVIDDPSFRRRDSPPGSNDYRPYRAPFAETVSDFGAIPSDVSGARSAQGFVIGEVAVVPQDWRSVSPPKEDETPTKLSKEQKKRDKAARQESQGEDITSPLPDIATPSEALPKSPKEEDFYDTVQSTVLEDEIEALAAEAQFYLERGDFERAEKCYSNGLEKFPESKEPLQVYTKLSMQMALVKYESGRYEDAQRDLERLRTEINPSTLPVRHDEITYHLARVMVRRGEYHEASYILEELQGGAKFKVMSDHLQGEPCVSDSEFDKLIPEVEVVLGSTRLAALLKGYYGRYAEANYSLENAIHWYQNVETQLLKKTSRGFGGSINDTSLGPLSQAPLGFEPIKAQIVLALIEISIIHKDGGRRDHYLELARSTLRSFERQFGAGHILTLEATALHAVMLSNMFDKQATSICAGAINTISRYLGKEHSLTMEVLSALVGIFIQQDRPYEAQDTITALVNQACDRLGPGHPQTVKYRCQLGEVNRIIGNYLKSRNELQSTYNHAVGESWHEGHPVILRCLTMLAFTNYSMLNLDIATEYIEKALRGQVAILKENGTGSKPAKSIADLLEGWIQKTSSSIPAANTIVTPHPDVLDSLEVYVEIRGMKEVEDTDRVGEDTLRILDFVYEKMKQCFGETHPATLKVGVRLSSMVPEESYDRKNAKQDFYDRIHHIRRQCDECLGPNHTLTWLAQMAISLSSNDLDDNLANIGNEMSVAVKRLVAQLGPRHPLTLEWMVRLFEIEVALGDESADNTAAQVLRQVRQKEVREERLMPSLDLEWKIAFLYCHQGRYEKGILILDHIEESWIKIKQFAKTSDVVEKLNDWGEQFAKTSNAVEKLNDWGERFRESSKEFRNRAKDLLREKLDEGSQGSVHDRESNIRRAVTLAKTLHDERAFETVRAQFELVKVLKGTEDIQKRVERLNILSDLVATMKKVESEPDKAQDGGNREDEKRQFAELSNKILDYWEKDPQRWEGKEGYLEGSEANF